MADDSDPVPPDTKQETPEYLKEVDVKFLNISVKGYEKKTVSSGFTKDEYYAYRIVSMYVSIEHNGTLADLLGVAGSGPSL